MYVNRKVRMGVAVIGAVAACSDGANVPVAPAGGGAIPANIAGGIPASGERVTVTRTISAVQPGPAGTGKQVRRVQRKKTFSFGAGTVVMRPGDTVGTAALNPKRRVAFQSVDDRPVLGLTVPAGRVSLRKSVLPWHTTTAVEGEPGLVVKAEGTGSAPASVTQFVRNGITELTVRQEWEFWQGQWNLMRRETTTPNETVRELIEVTRAGRRGTALASPAEWARGIGPISALSPSYDIYGDDEECGRCGKEKIALQAAWDTMLAKDALVLATCFFVPVPATVPACIIALSVVLDATIAYDKARAELAHCEATAPQCPPKTPPPGNCSVHSAIGRRFGPVLDCGSTGGGGGTAPTSHTECTYYFEYDLYTGDILYSELLYCVQVTDS